MPIELESAEQLSQLLKENSSKLVILDFFTFWCEPCRRLAPELQKIHDNYENVIVVKANAESDELEMLVNKYNVRAFPTLILFHENNVVDNFAGAELNRIMAAVKRFQWLYFQRRSRSESEDDLEFEDDLDDVCEPSIRLKHLKKGNVYSQKHVRNTTRYLTK